MTWESYTSTDTCQIFCDAGIFWESPTSKRGGWGPPDPLNVAPSVQMASEGKPWSPAWENLQGLQGLSELPEGGWWFDWGKVKYRDWDRWHPCLTLPTCLIVTSPRLGFLINQVGTINEMICFRALPIGLAQRMVISLLVLLSLSLKQSIIIVVLWIRGSRFKNKNSISNKNCRFFSYVRSSLGGIPTMIWIFPTEKSWIGSVLKPILCVVSK